MLAVRKLSQSQKKAEVQRLKAEAKAKAENSASDSKNSSLMATIASLTKDIQMQSDNLLIANANYEAIKQRYAIDKAIDCAPLTTDRLHIEADLKKLGFADVDYQLVLDGISRFNRMSHYSAMGFLRVFDLKAVDDEDSIAEKLENIFDLKKELAIAAVDETVESVINICKLNANIRGYAQLLRGWDCGDRLKDIDGMPEHTIAQILSSVFPIRENTSARMVNIRANLSKLLFMFEWYCDDWPHQNRLETINVLKCLKFLLNAKLTQESEWAKKNRVKLRDEIAKDIDNVADLVKGVSYKKTSAGVIKIANSKTNLAVYENLFSLKRFFIGLKNVIHKMNKIIEDGSCGPIDYDNMTFLRDLVQSIYPLFTKMYQEQLCAIVQSKFDKDLPIFNESERERQLVLDQANYKRRLLECLIKRDGILLERAKSELALLNRGLILECEYDDKLLNTENIFIEDFKKSIKSIEQALSGHREFGDIFPRQITFNL
jgi:hypothetical protein